MPQDNFACSFLTASQQTSPLQMMSSRTTSSGGTISRCSAASYATDPGAGFQRGSHACPGQDRSQVDVTRDVDADVTASGSSRRDCQSTV